MQLIKNKHNFTLQRKNCTMNKYSIIGRYHLMTSLAVTERIEYRLVAGKGGITLSLS